MFLKAFLTGYGDMVKAKTDLDRLKFLPQRVEDGVFYNFKGEDMFKGAVKGLEDLNIELIKEDRVNDTSRFTQALQRDYFEGFDKLIGSLDGVEQSEQSDTVEEKVDPVKALYDVVEAGDKKAFRSLRKELKDQWFALDDAEVEDAIFDLSDAVADKDLEFAKEIVEGLGQDLENPVETPEEDEGVIADEQSVDDEVSEIVEDIKSAIDDGDEKDFKELIAELKEIDKKSYNEWKDAFVAQPEENSEEEEDEVVKEILEDLEAAVEENDEAEIKELLEELAEEVGEDSDLYIEWSEKVAPKKEKRSRRRGK